MGIGNFALGKSGVQTGASLSDDGQRRNGSRSGESLLDQCIEWIAPCPWQAAIGSHAFTPARAPAPPLYTPEERIRRDRSGWTMVQAVLAPLQFLTFAISLALVLRYLATGHGYEVATGSIVLKTILLYAIMITGSIWEKEVFGKWLFAGAFFWEDVFSMVVLGLQTAYVAALVFAWGEPRQQMLIAVAAYAAYVINATQFLLKLRAARRDEARQRGVPVAGARATA